MSFARGRTDERTTDDRNMRKHRPTETQMNLIDR